MTEDKAKPPPKPPPGDKTQDRADILESNLYNAISKQENPVTLQFQVDRKTSADPVIIKALSQLFPRLNIKTAKILTLIRHLLMQKIPQGKELKLMKQVISLADKGHPEVAHLGVTLRAFATNERLAVEIKGVPSIPPRDGAIEKAFFDYESCPGAFKKDGSIDFREINKYPIVKAGDNLFFIAPEVPGRTGMQYDGSIIHVPEAKPMAIALNGGVDQVESMTRENRARGYFVRASKTGAVLLTRSEGKIVGVEIRDALDVKRLDYSTGNIGTHFVCPISMKIDTICNEFSIRAKGTVEVGELEGGHVETESSATIFKAHPGSSVRAEKNIAAHFSRASTLSSVNGYVSIIEEALDSRIDARGVEFDKYKGVFTGNTLDAEHIRLRQVYIGGACTIHFGRRLFNQRDALIDARARLKEDRVAQREKETQLTEKLQANIKALSKILKGNILMREHLKAFVLAAQAMDYDLLDQKLSTIAQTMNTKEVAFIQKSLKRLKKIPEAEEEARARDQAMIQRIARAEQDMGKMSLTIEATLRRAASLRIFTPDPDRKDPDQPDLFVENQQEKDSVIKVQGSYNRSQGFSLARV